MQGQSGIESAARPARRKPKQADPPTHKASRSRKKAADVISEPEPAIAALHPSPDEVSGMIATAAYYFAAERNFEAGHELEDWLRAEQLINSQLSR